MVADLPLPSDDEPIRITALLDDTLTGLEPVEAMEGTPAAAPADRDLPETASPRASEMAVRPAWPGSDARWPGQMLPEPAQGAEEAPAGNLNSAAGEFIPGVTLPDAAASASSTAAEALAANRPELVGGESGSARPTSALNYLAAVEAIERFYSSGPASDLAASLPDNLSDLLADVSTALSQLQITPGASGLTSDIPRGPATGSLFDPERSGPIARGGTFDPHAAGAANPYVQPNI